MSFLHTCSFSKVDLTFPHNFSVKSSYFHRNFSKVAPKFVWKIHQVSIKIFLKCLRKVPKIFSIMFLSGYFFNFSKIFNVRNSVKKDILSSTTCGCALPRWKTASRSSLWESAINCWIILWYTSAVIVVSKNNWSHYTFAIHGAQNTNFLGMQWRCSKNVRVLRASNTIILCIHVAI